MFRIKKSEKDCFVWSIKMFCTKNISFNSTKKNKQKPSKSKTHMHITKSEICFQYFPVYQTFKKYLFQALCKSTSEETPLQS